MDSPPPSGQQWTIRSGDQEAVLVEVGGGVRTYRVGPTDVVFGYAETELCPGSAGMVLAPWPNRIRDGRYTFAGEAYQLNITEPARHNAIHGLVNWARWRPVANNPPQNPDQVTLEHDLVPVPGYPWPLTLRTTWSVGPDGLRAIHEVTNLAATPAPYGLATHPYLAIAGVAVDDLTLRLPGRVRLLLDGRNLPIGAARVAGTEHDLTEGRRIGPAVLDVAYGDLIRDPDGGSSVTLRADDGRFVEVWADAGFGWWQVFTADTLSGARHRAAVAVEPMTCPPDSFRSGRDLITLEPGQTWCGSWGIRSSMSAREPAERPSDSAA
jgi:aldose 1-epimerase